MRDTIEQHYIKSRELYVKRIRGRLDNPCDAEDIVQEGYYRALKYAHTYNPDMPLEGWMVRIMHNAFRSYLAMINNRDNVELDEEEIEGTPEPTYPSHIWREINEMIDGNSEKEILSLYFIYGHKPREIAEITDRKYRDVTNLVHKFKTRISKLYRDK